MRERPHWKGRVPHALVDALAVDPGIGDALCGLGDALRDAMPARALELVALRVGAVLEELGAFVWAGHVFIAVDDILSLREVARLAADPRAFTGCDAVVLQAVDALLNDDRLDAGLLSALGDDALSVIVATSMYRMVATIMEGAEPERDATPTPGLETPARARATHDLLEGV